MAAKHGKSTGKNVPPEATKWKPGQSGNPKGRKPNKKALSELLREVGALNCPETEQVAKLKAFFGLKKEKPCSIDYMTALAVRYGAIPAAMKGNVGPAAMILERTEGKVTQPVDLPEGFAGAIVMLPTRSAA